MLQAQITIKKLPLLTETEISTTATDNSVIKFQEIIDGNFLINIFSSKIQYFVGWRTSFPGAIQNLHPQAAQFGKDIHKIFTRFVSCQQIAPEDKKWWARFLHLSHCLWYGKYLRNLFILQVHKVLFRKFWLWWVK